MKKNTIISPKSGPATHLVARVTFRIDGVAVARLAPRAACQFPVVGGTLVATASGYVRQALTLAGCDVTMTMVALAVSGVGAQQVAGAGCTKRQVKVPQCRRERYNRVSHKHAILRAVTRPALATRVALPGKQVKFSAPLKQCP